MSERLPLAACAEMLPARNVQRFGSATYRPANRKVRRFHQYLVSCGLCFALGLAAGLTLSRSSRGTPAAAAPVREPPVVSVRSLP